ncbi:riboflavin biosynthesis protein RibF [Terriglobus roseus]|uniref:Riboflavin biosynthesis protein n=1 Tax=Terriglobus roseus TaxID=392734 RepID=A0A1H4QCL1_9BACT|nr:riboflavin biosynthesis protein RibF [Terriglobus roseus]SEC17331.1 riboflavin kinase / FMN adenylyltransferase [Terriglobus roseus]
MIVFRSLAEVPADFGLTIVTIGNFDGVHCGHRTVISEVVARARAKGAKAVLVTLDPHPARVLRPESPLRLITPLPVKLELLKSTGLDAVLLLPFTQEFSRTSPRAFCETVLRDALHATEVHEGENFRFGYGAEADMHSLESLGAECCFTAHTFAPLTLGRQTVSSSRIRAVIAAGDMSAARHMLGRPFSVDSTPARGRGYGTQYAVPTINLAPYADLLPANGVYVTDLRVGTGASAVTFEGVTNIGNRPTFGEDSFAVETYLLRFHPIALDEATPLRMTFYKRLREERKWPSPEALKVQIGKDVARAERWFHLRRKLAKNPGAPPSRS